VHTISRTERVQAIVFLIVGILFIALVCGFVVGVPLLRQSRQYFVRFTESTAGLDKGTEVRYLGVKKGRVRDIKIDQGSGAVQVELDLEPDLRVTESMQARISSASLLGPYFVELHGKVAVSPDLPEGAVIKTDPSTMKSFLEKGMQAIDHMERVLKNLEQWTGSENEQKFAKLLDDAGAALATANQTMTSIKPEAERLVKNYADAADELRKVLTENGTALKEFLDESKKMVAEVNRFLESGRLDQVTNETARTLESVRGDFTKATASFTKFLEDAKIDQRLSQVVASLERTEQNLTRLSGVMQNELVSVTRGELGPALANFRDAMAALEELMTVLRNDPSLLIFSKQRPEIVIPRPGQR
jgi:phospholipid/cholesterol/gamma-HCH transport system substrate-binding protein